MVSPLYNLSLMIKHIVHTEHAVVISAGGIQSESDFPYCSGDGGCYPCMANKNKLVPLRVYTTPQVVVS